MGTVGCSLRSAAKFTRDSARAIREDPIGQIFAGQQHALLKGLLTEVRNARLAKGGGAFVPQEFVVRRAPMEVRRRLAFTFADRLAGRFVAQNSDHRQLAGRGCGTFNLIEKRKIDFLDYCKTASDSNGETVQAPAATSVKTAHPASSLEPPQLLRFICAPPSAHLLPT